MALHRRAAKRDAAEPAIVSALEALGCVVWRVSGKGLPDLIVLCAGKKWLADVKGPKEKPTPAQEKAWEEAATKARCAVFILRTPEDAQKMLNNALQPWEPERLTPLPSGGHLRSPPRTGSKAGRADYVDFVPPRKGDAAKAPHQLDALAKRLGASYTPPRQLVDGRPYFNGLVPKETLNAAKEAEATFAPPPYHRDGCTYFVVGPCNCGMST